MDHGSKVLKKNIPATDYPYWLGMLGGYGFDFLAWISRRKLTISSVRAKNSMQQLYLTLRKLLPQACRLFILWEMPVLWSLNLYVSNKVISYFKVNSL